MRKFGIAILVVLMLMNISALAGSIPEDLKGDDKSLIYFGEVIRYDPNRAENGYIELEVKKVIKGDVSEEKYIYADVLPIGEFDILPGAEYLIGYFDENNPVYVMETTTQDPRTLEIKHIYSDHMFARLEQYLNNGEIEAAEKERQQKMGQVKTEPDAERVPAEKKDNKMPYYIAIGTALAVVLGGIAVKGKNKKCKKQK